MTEWTKMTLRLPVQVHTALADDAKKRDKSLNQVIVDRLNRSLGGVYVSEEEANDGMILERLSALETWARQQDQTFGKVTDDDGRHATDVLIENFKTLRSKE